MGKDKSAKKEKKEKKEATENGEEAPAKAVAVSVIAKPLADDKLSKKASA